MTDIDLRKTQQRGFSLVELLAAIAVLGILVVLLAQTFTGTTTAYTVGMSQASQNSGSRAGLTFMTRELQTALCDDLFAIQIKEGGMLDGYCEAGGISFVTLAEDLDDDDPIGKRSAKLIRYEIEHTSSSAGPNTADDPFYYDRFQIVRYFDDSPGAVNAAYKDGANGNVWDPTSISASSKRGVLVDNVSSFRLEAYDFAGNRIATSGGGYKDIGGPNNLNGAGVAYVEVYIETLSKDIAPYASDPKVAGDGSSLSPREYVALNCNRYFTRVFLENALGARSGRSLF